MLFSSERGFFLALLDLGITYFQIPIRPSSGMLLRVHVRGDGLYVPPLVFVGLSTALPALHQVLHSYVCVGTLSYGMPSRLSRRLVLSCLLGARSQTDDPVAVLQLSLPRDCGHQGGAGHCVLADCEVFRYDHRYRGRHRFSVSDTSR